MLLYSPTHSQSEDSLSILYVHTPCDIQLAKEKELCP